MSDRGRLLASVVLALLVAISACAPSRTAHQAKEAASLVGATVAGLEAEATDPLAAEPWLAALERAVESDDPRGLAAAAAALDALVMGRVAFGAAGLDQAIAHRSAPHMALVSGRLQRLYHRAERQPVVRALVAEALHVLALRVGAPEAAAWRERSGCAQRAAMAGPIGWPPLTALSGPSPLSVGAAFPAWLPGPKPFAHRAAFEVVHADACAFDVDATSPLHGERLIVVDAPGVARELFIALTSAAAARVEIGDVVVIDRPFDDGPVATTHLARLAVTPGRARIVVRVAHRGDAGPVTLRVIDAHGGAVSLEAPPEGSLADATVIQSQPVTWPAPTSDAERLVAAAAALALGRAREALTILEAVTTRSAPVEILRLRALETAQLTASAQRRRALEAAVARAEEACPRCWPVRLAAAAVAGERRGHGAGAFAALEALGVREATLPARATSLELARIAELARGADLHDLARRAHDAVAALAPGSALAADLDAALHRRTGDDLVEAACRGGTSRASTRCVFALVSRGQLEHALDELDRLRALRGSQSLHRDLELELLVSHGEIDRAMILYDVLSPAQRSLALLGALRDDRAARDRFTRDMRSAADSPAAIEPLVRHFGVARDPARLFEREGATLVAQDRAQAYLPGAGTAVLRHVEHYQVDETGLFHFSLYDLRRVSDAIDVADGTWVGLPMVGGRAASRVLRRRVHKADGRVIDPDPDASGAQGNTDLSGLEAGDYVELLVVGWALPDDDGQLVVDTPDLLPPRTSVREAVVSISRPATLPLSLWRHELLGEGETSDGRAGHRVTVWRLTDVRPRRLEEGVPPLEARVGSSFGTDTWDRIASTLAERFASLDEDDPFVDRWAREAVQNERDPGRQVARIVAAAGKALPQADPNALSDFVASLSRGGQRETARYILERGTGSRTWVIHRALRALGIESEIAVAETRPFSAAPGFPPRVGRFVRPVLAVHIGGEPLWIDADVEGPPLPPGRVSPELRGRKALTADGRMIDVAAESDPDPDVIDLRLTLDATGDAEGTFTALLRGRTAQRLADAFEVVVGSERDALLRNVVLGWLPGADVRSVVLSSDPGTWEVAVRAEIALVGFARPESRDGKTRWLPGIEPLHEVFPFPATSTVGGAYASQSERRAALAIGEPTVYRLRRRIDLPPGARVIATPAPLALEGTPLAASRRLEREGATITERFHLDLGVGTIAPDAFEAFAARARAVDDGFLHGIRIELP